jgi:hypothetical protein
MIPNPTSAILLILIGAPALFLVMFLPAFLELRRPKDRGHRIIMNDFHRIASKQFDAAMMVNIDEEQWFDHKLLPRLMKVTEVLPCLEV